ncbi:MAG: N-acetylneuraminate lyase, partial [Flavobacteriaceae bacterium]|nr:N-acetylneuraminate lyase [Flavobacteriaceae bacterium]
MNVKPIEGIIAAPFTPMDKNKEINPLVISDYAKKLKKDGLSGVFICGTTGEGMLMTLEERKIIAEEWIKFQQDDFKVIVHVGTTSIKQSQELAQHAQQIGAYGTSTMGP